MADAEAISRQNYRFPTINEEEVKRILNDKDSLNTKRTTDGAMKTLRLYLKERGFSEMIENMSVEQIDGILQKFYIEVRQANGEKYQRSSLFKIRHGINRYLSASKSIDIVNDVMFKKSNKVFTAVTKELKREGKGAVNHYPPIEDVDLQKMYSYFDTNDNIKLQHKVFADIMLYFGRRGRENIHNLLITDFAATTDSDGNVYMYMTRDEATKNHQNDPNSPEGRMYAKPDDPLCPVKSFMIYKRHLNVKCARLFQRPNTSVSALGYYGSAPLGHNSIGKMMPVISEAAGLSKRYTNHSLRSTSVHILDRKQFAGRHVMSVTGHKSETSLKTYTGYTDQRIKKRMSDSISESLRPATHVENVQSKRAKLCTSIPTEKENTPPSPSLCDIDIADTCLEPLSNSQMNTLLSDIEFPYNEVDNLMRHINTEHVVRESTVSCAVNRSNGAYPLAPMPTFYNCSGITINYNFK